MTTVDIPEKQHRKLKKEAVRRKIDLKDLVSEKLSGLIIMALLFVGGFGLSAFADHDVPFDFWDSHACTFEGTPINSTHMEYGFYCNWQGIFEQLTNDWQKIVPTEDGNYTRNLAGAIIIQAPDGSIQEKIVEEPAPTKPIIEVLEPEEPLTFEERQIEDSIKKLDECLRGMGAWAAYQSQTDIEYYLDETRWAFADRDNLSSNIQILRILKAIEECDIMRTYERMHLIGAYELNKVLADIADVDYLGRSPEHPLSTDETDQSDAMVETDPVTDKDIADEVSEAEELRDRLIAERVFEDPDADFAGINRGGQPAGLKCQAGGQPTEFGEYPDAICPLDSYNAHIARNPDITQEDIQQLLCTHYLGMYIHKLQDSPHDFPLWLNHCVPKVVREG